MAERDKPGEGTDDQVLQNGFGVPLDYESPALEEFGGQEALPLARKRVPPTPAEQKYLVAPRSGGEKEQFEKLRAEFQRNIEYSLRAENPGMSDEEVSERARVEAKQARFLPPYRAPDADLQSRLNQSIASKVIGRRVIRKPDEDEQQISTIERLTRERGRQALEFKDKPWHEALGEAYRGTAPAVSRRDAQAGGLFLADDPRATEDQLKWGTIAGATVGAIAARSTINAARIAAAAGAGAPMGPVGIGATVVGNLLLGSAIGYFGTGIAYSYDQDEFWDTVELYGGEEHLLHGMVAPRGVKQLIDRGGILSGGYDVASSLMRLSSNWTEEDDSRFGRQVELAAPGMNFNALVDLGGEFARIKSGEVEADEEHIKQLEAAYMNTYLSLAPADLPKQLVDDYRVEVERAIRFKWPKKSKAWASRQAEQMTSLSAQSLRNLISARPLLEDRGDIPGLQAAIGKLKAGADDADVEQTLRTISVAALLDVGLLIRRIEVDGKRFQAPILPLSRQHMAIVAKNVEASRELQKATGGDSTGILERAFGELMLSRVEGQYGEINYVESNAGRFMRLMMAPQELLIELPLATIDRVYGLGTRPAGTGYWNNVLASVASGSGGLTMNALMMMSRAGWDRESAAYKAALFFAVGADFLAPWEEASVYVPFSAMRSARQAATIPGRILPKGVPKGKMRAAMASPAAYRLYHKLVYGKDSAPMFSDTYSAANHVIDSMIREAFYKGDAHKGQVPKLVESQMKLLFEKLGVEGGYDTVKAMAMRVSEDTFGSTLSSIHDIIENGTATQRGLRSTPGYKSAISQVKKMVEAGNLKKEGAALYMALLEIQAVRFSQDPNLPQFKSPEDYFNKIQHLVGGRAGPNAKFSGIHPEVRNVGAETLGKVHGERVKGADAVPSPEEVSSAGRVDLETFRRLAERLGIEMETPAFQAKLEELGFDAPPTADQADAAKLYSAMQRGHFGGDPAKLPQPAAARLPRNPLDYDEQAAGPILPGMDLASVERALIGSEIEHGAWFDGITDQQVGRREGLYNKVPLHLWDYIRGALHGNLVFTHVHPNGSFFSNSDILCAVLSDYAELRAVNSVGGEVWAMSRPEGGWGPDWNLKERLSKTENYEKGWREFIASPAVRKLEADLNQARHDALIGAVYRHSQDILDATGDPKRADAFRDKGYKQVLSSEKPGFDPKGWSKYVNEESAYDAEKFKAHINEELAQNYGEALRDSGIEIKFRRGDSGSASKPGLAPESDAGSVARELQGIQEAWRGEARADINIESEQTGLFGKKPKPEAEGPETVEALTEPVAEAIADIVEAPGGIGIDPAGVSAALKAGGEVSTGELAVDRSRILDLLGQQMYAGSVAEVAIKELTQNSWDAVKRATVDGEIQPGEAWIDVEINRDDWSITVKDNGNGMTADTVRKAFFTIGGTDKGINPDLYSDSGGLGMAKIQFLFISKRVELTTVRNGVKVTVDTVPAVIKEEGGKFDMRQEATSEPNGTTVKITLPRELLQRGGEVKDVNLPDHWFGSSFLRKPLIGDVEIRQRLVREDGSLLEQSDFAIPENNAGHAFNLDAATPFWSTATFDWGTADIYMAVERSSDPKIEVLSSGLYQFDWYRTSGSTRYAWGADGVPSGQAEMLQKALPYKLIVDIKPTVKATDTSYPFNNQREGFRPGIEEDIKALGAYLIGHGRGIEAEATAMVFEQTISMERVDLDDMFAEIEGRAPRAPRFLTKRTAGGLAREIPKEFEVGGGKIRVGGRVFLTEEEVKNVYRAAASFKAGAEAKKASAFFDTTKVDPSKPLFHNNTNLEIPESAQPMLAKLGTVVLEFKERLAALHGYEILNQPDVIYAAGISLDKEYQGVHVRVPYRAFFLNPLSNVGRKLDGVVGAWFNTLIHEGAHTNIKGHVTEEGGADFSGEMGVLYAKLADSGDARVIQESLERILDEHWDEYDALRSSYERSTTQNVASSLESEDQLPAIKDERLRPGVLGTRGEDVGPEGRPIERVERGPGEGGVFEPEPGGATVIEAIHSNLVGARGVEAGAPAAAKLPDELYSLASDGTQVKSAIDESQELKVPTVQASRRLSTLLKNYSQGKISTTTFHNRLVRLADEMETVKELKEDKRISAERVRGADMLREKLIRARRKGDLDAEQAGLALWLIDKNPALADDLSLSIRKPYPFDPEAAGVYLPLPRIVRLFKGDTNPATAVHEILHHTERMMPIGVKSGIRRAWASALTRELKNANPEQAALLQKMLNREKGASKEITKAFKDGVLDRSQHYQFVNPSEFWAVNGSRILSGRYEVKGNWVGAAKQWIAEFIQTMKGLLGLQSDAPILAGLKSVLDGDGTFVSRTMLSGTTSRPLRAPEAGRKYPIADRGEWYGDADYEGRGGVMVEMTPDEFLARSRPLEIDEAARDNIDDLKSTIERGGTLDPLALYRADLEDVRASDGRHRAIAAKELGIREVPVIDFTAPPADPGGFQLGEDLPLTYLERAHDGNYRTIHVDPRKLDADWSKDADYYVPKEGRNPNSEQKYQRFLEFARSGRPVEIPRVSLGPDAERPVSFADGRHRFAVLRDQGEAAIPVQVPAENAIEFASRYGVDPGSMKPPVEKRGPSRLLAGISGARGEFPEVGIRYSRYRALLNDIKKLDDEVASKQGGRYTESQENARYSIHAELDEVLTEVYNVFKPDLDRVLTENAHPDDIKLSSVRGPDLDQGGLPGWAGEPGQPFVQLGMDGDPRIIQGRLAQFNKAYKQESLVIREAVETSDLPDGYLDDLSAPIDPELSASLLYTAEGGGVRAPTMRIELNERIISSPEVNDFLRVAELERAGVVVVRNGDAIDMVYLPEMAKQPVRPGEFLAISRNAAALLSDFAESKGLGTVAAGHIRENIYVSAEQPDLVHGAYKVRGYDDVIKEGLNAEDARHVERYGADVGVAEGLEAAESGARQTAKRTAADKAAPGRQHRGEHLPDPTPARQSEVARELTPELGRHLDREGGRPQEVVGKAIKQRLKGSGMSKAGIKEATRRLRPDDSSALKTVGQRVELELSLPDDANGAPRSISFDVRLVRTDRSTALVPGGLDGEFSFPDLDYVTRRPILLDPKFNLQDVAELSGKEAARLRQTYKAAGIPEDIVNEALGFTMPEDRVYSNADIASAMRAASAAYEDLSIGLYRKHLNSMGTAKYRPEPPEPGTTPSQDYLDTLEVHALDQLGIMILAMTSAGTNIVENQLLTAAIRPRSRAQLSQTATLIREAKARKKAWYEQRAEKAKRFSQDELEGQDLDALSQAYVEIGLPRDAAEQLVGRGDAVYPESRLDDFLNEAKKVHEDLSREEAQYLVGLAITTGSKVDAKHITKGILGEVRGGGFRKWWEPGTPFQAWEWDGVKKLNEKAYKDARANVIAKMERVEVEMETVRADIDADKALLKTEKTKARKTSIRKRIKQSEAQLERARMAHESMREFLRYTAGEFIPQSPMPRLTEGFVSRSHADPRLIANLLLDFDDDLARVAAGKQSHLWFEKHPGETFDDFIMRVQSSTRGMGSKTSSFALAMTDPARADSAAIDVHLIRKHWRKIVPDADKRMRDWYAMWKQGAGERDPRGGASSAALARRQSVDFKDYVENYSSDWVGRIQGMLAPRPMKVQPRGMEIDIPLRKKELKRARAGLRAGRVAGASAADMAKLEKAVDKAEGLLRAQQAVSKWDKLYPDHPAVQAMKDGDIRVTIDAYERAVNAIRNDPATKEAGLSTFGSQWLRWDQIRRYYEPEMAAAPGASAIPGQSAASLLELRRELAELHFFRNSGKTSIDPDVRMYSHEPEGGHRIMFSGDPDSPRGSFEIDGKTGKMLIRMFETGDLGVLFHENGHLLESLLGAQWRDELHKNYPRKIYPELIEQDLIAGMGLWEFPGRRLTPEASEQLAEAWRIFLQTKVGPGGPVRRQFVDLYRTLQDYWLRVRNQPQVLPARMVDLFDSYFRPVDVATEASVGLVAAAKSERMPRVSLDSDMAKRWSDGKAREAQQKMNWERVDTRDEHLRQAMDIPEDLTEMDAVDLYSRIYSYIATEQTRKLAGPMGLISITDRSHVPANRVKMINKQVRERSNYYMQRSPEEMSNQIIKETRNGKEVSVFELNDAQAAGFKRLVEDMAGEPMGNIIYAKMLESGYDFARPTVAEYNVAIEVMKDVVAGAGSRKTGYSERISPSMGYALWNTMKSAANNLADDKRWRVIEGSRDWIRNAFSLDAELADMDPISRNIIQSGARRMADAPDWARRQTRKIIRESRSGPARDGETETRIHIKVLNDLREALEWPVNPSKVWLDESKTSPLLDMHKKFTDLKRVEDNRRLRWDKDNPDKFPNADEYADFTTEELFADLDQIKMLLRDEGDLLPENVVVAIDKLEIYKRQLRTRDISNLNEFEQFELGGAINEIEYAIGKRIEVVAAKADELASSIAGSEASGLHGALTIEHRMQLYSWFYRGKFEEMVDFVSNRGYHTGLEKNRMSRLDMSEVMLEMIIRLKAQQEYNRMLEDLTRYNLKFDVRDLDTAKQFRTDYDKTAFAERVKHYLAAQLGGDRSIRAMYEDGKKVATQMPAAPRAADYPKRDQLPGPSDEFGNLHDMRAYFKASEIIDRWGIGTFSGKWETFTAPDGTELFMPSVAKQYLQEAIDRAAGVGNTYGRSSVSKRFLPERRGLPTKDPEIAENLDRSLGVVSWSAVGKAINWLWQMNPVTAARIKMGVTTGLIIPNAPYYVSVAIGAWFQMFQGLGPLRTLRASFPTRMTFAVITRLFKEGSYRPEAPAIVTKDGRIYTADMLADMAQKHGLNQSFIRTETVGAVADDIAKMTPDGVLESITTGFSRWQDTLIESATAIDNYFRVGVFIDELAQGASPDAAASLARKVGYDYSALTDFERKTMRDTILFYSYMRKNQDLFWDTMLTNPSRVIGQFRLMRGLQQIHMDDDAEVVLDDHLKGRLAVYWRDVQKQTTVHSQVMFIPPPLPVTDAVGFYVDGVGSLEALTSSARDTEHLRGMVSRLTPWVQAPFVAAFNEDIFFERDLDKYNRVPAWFIEADYMITGGTLIEGVLDVDDQAMYDPVTEDFPGQGFYHARNGKAWWVFRRLLQIPGFGRSMDVIESLDRSNIGAVELPLEGLRAVRMKGVREGYLDYPRPERIGELPSDISPELAGPRHGELSSAEELSGFFGLRPVLLTKEDVKWAQYLRRHGYDIKDQIKKEEEGDVLKRR